MNDDLNIDNYSFSDILTLFRLDADKEPDLKKCREMVERLHPSRSRARAREVGRPVRHSQHIPERSPGTPSFIQHENGDNSHGRPGRDKISL